MSQTKKLSRRDFLRITMIAFGGIALSFCTPENEAPTPLSIVKSDKYIDLGTHKLHIVLSDIQSEYTIVLEAGGGKYSKSYQKIQDDLATLTGIRVMSYDRSGFGQSELGPDHFTAVDEVDALKKCLEIQGFKNKFILVGHSYGGYLIQLFASQYPELVSGLVLIDPMNTCFVDKFGLDNLMAVTPHIKNPINNSDKAVNRMIDSAPESFKAMKSKELPTEIPVILITSGRPPYSNPILWRQCHEEMVMNSKKHQLVIADGNDHDIVEENPELVIKTMVELINRIKS